MFHRILTEWWLGLEGCPRLQPWASPDAVLGDNPEQVMVPQGEVRRSVGVNVRLNTIHSSPARGTLHVALLDDVASDGGATVGGWGLPCQCHGMSVDAVHH